MRSFELGFMARPFKEQFPELSEVVAENFDKDNKELSRLRIRGYITDSARDAIVKKIGNSLSKALKAPQHGNN